MWMRERKAVDVAYLDSSKAFVTVSHRILELTAEDLGECTVCWMKYWLDDRHREWR